MTEEMSPSIQINKLEDGRNTIIFRKAALKGKVTSEDVMNTILIAARMQAEKYVEKLSRGAPLEVSEIKALKELAEIAKIDVPDKKVLQDTTPIENIDKVKQTLYQALTERLSAPKANDVDK